jgi:hypothetical protein
MEKLLDSVGRRFVEGGRRLVQEEHRRIELKTSDERDDLSLTARKVAASFIEKCFVPFEGFEDAHDPCPVESLPSVRLEGEGKF